MGRLLAAGMLLLGLAGCVSAIKTVVTAPIKVVSKTADVLTTSQSESDEKRGRKLREKDEKLGKLARLRDKAQRKCDGGDDSGCDEAAKLDAEIEAEQNRPV